MTAMAKQLSTDSRGGSALILTVVLTSLLAIVGVLFLMAARIDKMATSATSENQELTFAVETLVAQISEVLVEDVPGVVDDQEYYDYPDANDPWLADLEPYSSGGNYSWRQISDVTGYLAQRGFSTRMVDVDPPGPRKVLGNYSEIRLSSGQLEGQLADADGDGIADSKWIELGGVTSRKGQPIYAAVRVIDNQGMLNVNTGSRFDETEGDETTVDGTSQLQVNVVALAGRPGRSATTTDVAALLGARANDTADSAALDLSRYEREVIWRYQEPISFWTPFDLSDELELRYRYCINSSTRARLESVWYDTLASKTDLVQVPYDGYTDSGPSRKKWRRLDDWRERVTNDLNAVEPDRRHLATTYNMDRIIMPKRVQTSPGIDPGKMVNVNDAGEFALREAIAAALSEADAGFLGVAERAAQITANVLDFIDDDSEVTVIQGSGWSSAYYGFEQPCIYISELACRFVPDPSTGDIHKSYAVELHRPYFEDPDPLPGRWRLVIDNVLATNVEETITWSGTRRFHVLRAEDAQARLAVAFADSEEPLDTMQQFGYGQTDYGKTVQTLGATGFEEGATITLERRVGPTDTWVKVDYVRVPSGWTAADGEAHSIQRDISAHKCVRRLWASAATTPGLGHAVGNYVDADQPDIIQAHPENRPLKNIGELGMVFAISAYNVPEAATAADVLIDLRNPVYARPFARLFNYLTVINPETHGAGAGETRVMGRININTAPSFVIAQLPWMQYRDSTLFARARAIVDYRNNNGPYESIADVMQVDALVQPGFDGDHNQYDDDPRGPDLTPDTARDDFEERDIIFTRISNLVTVRSDVFTAYILVRIGVDGPQRRMLALFDRSQVRSSSDDVRLVALHQVADPR